MKLFGRAPRQTAKTLDAASIPAGRRVYAVGDIHGMADQLRNLLTKIRSDLAEHPEAQASLVFLGDYVDRGGDSKGVLDCLLNDDLPAESTYLMGNHEELMLNFLDDPETAEQWRHFGGLETLHSYGVDIEDVLIGRGYERARNDLVGRLPARHLRFLQDLEGSAEHGDYFFCHAGVRPGVPLAKQERSDLLWIRDEFLRFDGGFEKIVVHGHTPGEEVEFEHTRINVDTGAYATQRLSAVCLFDAEQQVISSAADDEGARSHVVG
jgi:diadenosine tetraphosphatase ApaH/serine/threonine PP2A family protein phosphatase